MKPVSKLYCNYCEEDVNYFKSEMADCWYFMCANNCGTILHKEFKPLEQVRKEQEEYYIKRRTNNVNYKTKY